MVRYETYQSNAAEAPIMRRWLLLGLTLSLIIHAGLVVAFHMKKLHNFGMRDEARLAPPTEILTRVSIPQVPADDTRVTLPTSQPKPAKLVIPDEKPVVQEVQIKSTLPEFTRAVTQEKPVVKPPGATDVLAKVEAASRGAMEKELNSLAGSMIKDSYSASKQPRIKMPAADKMGNGEGSAAGIPGRQSLEDALAHVGPMPSGNKPIGMPGGALFEYDSADLKPESIEQLQKLAELVRRNPKATFGIEGHTDSFGTPDYNMNLSLRRAESVKAWLVANMSISPDRIQTRGFGNTRPIVSSEKSVEAQAPNRRVEIVIRPYRK